MSKQRLNREGKEILQDSQGFYTNDYDGKRVNTDMYGEKFSNDDAGEGYGRQGQRTPEQEKAFINAFSKTPLGSVIGLFFLVFISYSIVDNFFPDPFMQIVDKIYDFKLLFLGLAILPTVSLIKSNKNEIMHYHDNKSNKVTRGIEADGKKIVLANQLVYVLATISFFGLIGIDKFILGDIIKLEFIGGLIVLVRGYIIGTYLLLSFKEKKPAGIIKWIRYLRGQYIEDQEFSLF